MSRFRILGPVLGLDGASLTLSAPALGYAAGPPARRRRKPRSSIWWC